MTDSLGDDVLDALRELVRTIDDLPGQYSAEFSLTYWGGVVAPAEPWLCTVEGDIHGDDGDSFSVLGLTASEVLRAAALEARARIP